MTATINVCMYDCLWAGLSIDFLIEQVLMRSMKTSRGLTRGWGMTEQQCLTWLLSSQQCHARADRGEPQHWRAEHDRCKTSMWHEGHTHSSPRKIPHLLRSKLDQCLDWGPWMLIRQRTSETLSWPAWLDRLLLSTHSRREIRQSPWVQKPQWLTIAAKRPKTWRQCSSMSCVVILQRCLTAPCCFDSHRVCHLRQQQRSTTVFVCTTRCSSGREP